MLGGPAGEESRFHYRLQGRLVRALEDAEPPWLDDAEDRDRLLRAVCERALEELREVLGEDPSIWRWGTLHAGGQPHPLDAVPGLGRTG